MKRSSERILTTHTGSLPRPKDLVSLLVLKERGELKDQAAFDNRVRRAVNEVVKKQAEVGIDVVNDGEQGKIAYGAYVKDRLTGFGGETYVRKPYPDVMEFPEYEGKAAFAAYARPACNGPVGWKDKAAIQKDIEHLKAAAQGSKVEEVFMSAASPGVIAFFLRNQYYPSHEAYVHAIAQVMKEEYVAIHKAGFLLQLDCPDLAMGRHIQFADKSLEEFKKIAQINVEALNEAVADIPPDRMRMHLCWGNYEGPHHWDVPLKEIIGLVLTARPAAILFEGANPRHEHEWAVFKDVALPDHKVLVPGVIDSTTNFIEHPELVAQRIVRYAEIVGRERVIAGADCGFATSAASPYTVYPSVAWAKFKSMAEGARLATKQLWR